MATFTSFRRRALLCGAVLATVIAGLAVSMLPAQAADAPAAGGTYTIASAGQCLNACTQWRVEGTRQYFMILAAGQYPNYPSGIEDNTHFQAYGAIEVARLVATALNGQGILGAGYWQKLTSPIPTSAVVWPSTAPSY